MPELEDSNYTDNIDKLIKIMEEKEEKQRIEI